MPHAVPAIYEQAPIAPKATSSNAKSLSSRMAPASTPPPPYKIPAETVEFIRANEEIGALAKQYGNDSVARAIAFQWPSE